MELFIMPRKGHDVTAILSLGAVGKGSSGACFRVCASARKPATEGPRESCFRTSRREKSKARLQLFPNIFTHTRGERERSAANRSGRCLSPHLRTMLTCVPY